jgi:DNA-binding LacI/PurR family transcriptional regulator
MTDARSRSSQRVDERPANAAQADFTGPQRQCHIGLLGVTCSSERVEVKLGQWRHRHGEGNTYYPPGFSGFHDVALCRGAAMKSPKGTRVSATSRDVARAANVSQALVSRAFTGNGRIAPETRAHILKVAREIGWQPNALARSMVTGDAPLVAVITARLDFDWRAQVLSRFLRAIQDWQLKPLLFYAHNDDDVDALLGETISWRTRGVIVTAGAVGRQRAADILANNQFLVALNRSANHPKGFSVATDNILGGAMAADLLADEGRERFLILAGPQDKWAPASRTRGFVDQLRRRGHEPRIWHSETMTFEEGRDGAAALLDLPRAERPDAVFATNDALALGMLDGLMGHLAVPDDLSVVGFDNLPAASWTPYRLTTIEQPIDYMVGRVLDYLNESEDGTPPGEASLAAGSRIGEDGMIFCPPRVVTRATTRGAT